MLEDGAISVNGFGKLIERSSGVLIHEGVRKLIPPLSAVGEGGN